MPYYPKHKQKKEQEAKEKFMDGRWRKSRLYTVADKMTGEAIPFVATPAQTKLFEAIDAYNRVIVLKARQLGVTTGCCIYLLDEGLFRRNVHSLSILQTQDHAINTFEKKVQFNWENVSEKIKEYMGWKLKTDQVRKLSFVFPKEINQPYATSSYSVANSGRSGTFQLVHISELSYVDLNWPHVSREIITGTIPAVPSTGKIIIESTANGEEGNFANLWREAVAGRNGYFPLFLSWRDDVLEISKTKIIPVEEMPDFFREAEIKFKLTPEEISYYYSKWQSLGNDFSLLKQEYPTTPEEAFSTSVEKMFDAEVLSEYLQYVKDGNVSGKTTIFSTPKPGHTYAIGADPSEGVGKDSSTAVVIDLSGLKPSVVAHYANDKADPSELAYILIELSNLYNRATIAVERNNHGHAVLAILKKEFDDSLLFREAASEINDSIEAPRYGFNTTSSSKPFILHELSRATREFAIDIPSRAILTEMQLCPRSETLRLKSTDLTTRHFDLLMALAIAYHSRNFALSRSGAYVVQETETKEFDPHAII